MSSVERTARLKPSEKFGYAIGDAGFNFYWIIIGSYLSYFYTDIFGLSAAAAGTMFLLTKIIDACTDPIMGAVADRTESRFGKFRPYLLFGALPMAGAAILTMSTPNLSDGGKLLWAYGTYSMMMVCYTILSTPYSSLAGVITANTDERNSVFGLRFFFAYFTGIIVGAFTPGLAQTFGGGDEAFGWQMTMTLYSTVATLCFLAVFFTTHERVRPPANQSSKAIDDIKDLLNNRPWLILFALAMIIMITIVFRGSSATYYFKYFVERPDLMGAYIGVQMAAYAVGCLLTPYLTKLVDKAKLLIWLMALVGGFSVLFAFVPKPSTLGVVTVAGDSNTTLRANDLLGDAALADGDFIWRQNDTGVFWFINNTQEVGRGPELALSASNEENPPARVISVIQVDAYGTVVADSSDLPWEILTMFALNILISLCLGPKSPITWSMYADAADYNEWKTGRRATAMTFSAATFSQKLGGALGSAGILWILAAMGYAANQLQVGASLTSIVWLQTLVPAAFAFIAIVALKYYPLTRAMLEQIQFDLQQREKDSQEGNEVSPEQE